MVLAGRDAQQNELLVKRHLRQGDAYVHADIVGAGSIVVKNHLYPTLQIPPPKTLHEAGNFSICASRAWEAKIVTSAWWVRSDQVSKTAPSGEYLGTGSFMIRGSKNFLPPMQLSLSFGFVFVVDDETRAAKKAQRLAIEQEKRFDSEDTLTSEKYRVDGVIQAVDAMIIDTSAKETTESKQTAQSKSKGKDRQQQQQKQQQKQRSVSTEAQSKENSKEKGQGRAKKGKEKKTKKYAYQDEEEQELHMMLLGTAKRVEKKPEPPKKKLSEPKPTTKPNKPVESSETLAVQPKVNDDGEEADADESGNGEFIAADYFTMTPESDKEYLYALPVCYPTSAFTTARFRVKLIPGNLKKGKAVKSAVALLTEASSCPSQHLRDLMRAVPENELLAVMPAKVALGVSAHETAKLKKRTKKK